MSIPDSLMMDYFELLTDVPDEELEGFRQELSQETTNPMILKKRLAREIVTQLYDQKAASKAEEHFARVFQRREVPKEIREYHVALHTGIGLRDILVETHLAKSRSEASRLIAQGAVTIDGEKITSNIAPVQSGSIIKVGKRRFVRLVDAD